MLQGIPPRIEASDVARAAATLSPSGSKVKEQAVAAFLAALTSGKVKETGGKMTVDIELTIDTEPLYPPGKMVTSIDIQGSISEGWQAFTAAMKAEGYEVKDTSNIYGGYTHKTATVTWSTVG